MTACQAAVADGTLPQAEVKTAPVEIPQGHCQRRFYHHFCLGGLQGAAQVPRDIAKALLDHMELKGFLFYLR